MLWPTSLWEVVARIVAGHVGAIPVTDPDLLDPVARWYDERGRERSLADYLAAEESLYLGRRRLLTVLDPFDALVCPTLTEPALLLGALKDEGAAGPRMRAFVPFVFWANCTGQPAISLPLAESRTGLSIGVQLGGRPLCERTILALAASLDDAWPWHDRAPSLPPTPYRPAVADELRPNPGQTS